MHGRATRTSVVETILEANPFQSRRLRQLGWVQGFTIYCNILQYMSFLVLKIIFIFSLRISCCLDTRTGWWSITRFTPLGKHLSYPGATPTKSTIYNVFLCISTFNKRIFCLLSFNALNNVLFGQYVYLATEQAETYLKICVLIYHLTYVHTFLFRSTTRITHRYLLFAVDWK